MAAERAHDRRLVQFMHPGAEPGPGEGRAWNQGPHRRKFLRSPGTWLDGDTKHDGQVVFWGEWEPESRAECVRDPIPEGPRQVFVPYYRRPPTFVRHQNTDPFVSRRRLNEIRAEPRDAVSRLATGPRPSRQPTTSSEFLVRLSRSELRRRAQ